MLFNLTVGEAGVVSLAKGTGNVAIEAGERLGTLALDDPSLVAKAEPFISELGDFAPPLELRVREGKLHMQLQYLTQRVHNVLDGYTDNEEELLKGLSELLIDPTVMCHEWDQLMMGVGSKLPDQVRSKLKLLTPDPEKDEPFGAKVLEILEAALDDPSKDEASKVALKGQAAPVFEFGNRFKGGPLDMSTGVVRSFIEHFLRVEKLYPDDRSELLGVFNLCQAHPNDPATALQGVLSHCNVERKVPPDACARVASDHPDACARMASDHPDACARMASDHPDACARMASDRASDGASDGASASACAYGL